MRLNLMLFYLRANLHPVDFNSAAGCIIMTAADDCDYDFFRCRCRCRRTKSALPPTDLYSIDKFNKVNPIFQCPLNRV